MADFEQEMALPNAEEVEAMARELTDDRTLLDRDRVREIKAAFWKNPSIVALCDTALHHEDVKAELQRLLKEGAAEIRKLTEERDALREVAEAYRLVKVPKLTEERDRWKRMFEDATKPLDEFMGELRSEIAEQDREGGVDAHT